eukprot:Opistho-2@74476
MRFDKLKMRLPPLPQMVLPLSPDVDDNGKELWRVRFLEGSHLEGVIRSHMDALYETGSSATGQVQMGAFDHYGTGGPFATARNSLLQKKKGAGGLSNRERQLLHDLEGYDWEEEGGKAVKLSVKVSCPA